MKNIHILPTDNYKNIYITNDEEIKVGDWVLFENTNNIRKSVDSTFTSGVNNIRIYADKKVFKIILTTDPDLIKDGVQAIDDEFLEWFVKNPSCEEVEIKKGKMRLNCDGEEIGFPNMSLYKIIIPKEEPKQETLEEFAERLCPNKQVEYDMILEGAKWQQERMYSEEEVENILIEYVKTNPTKPYRVVQWFQQFKKK